MAIFYRWAWFLVIVYLSTGINSVCPVLSLGSVQPSSLSTEKTSATPDSQHDAPAEESENPSEHSENHHEESKEILTAFLSFNQIIQPSFNQLCKRAPGFLASSVRDILSPPPEPRA